MRFAAWVSLLFALGPVARAEETAAQLADRLRAEIAALRPAQAVRQAIGWRKCLLEAFREARERKKPVLIWAFRGDPDEGRC
jgi:hypothetical protein